MDLKTNLKQNGVDDVTISILENQEVYYSWCTVFDN